MQNVARIRVIVLGRFSETIHTIKGQIGWLFMAYATRILAVANVAIPPDLAAMFAACEDAYEKATQEGYAEYPAVVAAVSVLKSAWTALHVANSNLLTAKGFFAVEFATMHANRACQTTRKACVHLQAAINQAAAENRLYNRCLLLTDADQAIGKQREDTTLLRRVAS